MTSKTTTGTAKAGTNTYGYDDAGRLTSWNADGKTTQYAWDDSGNRVKNGDKTAAFDERNRLLSDGDYTYDYSARGTLASRTSSGLKEDFTFDAFDRMTKAGESGTQYTYDALDRIASRNGTDFAYAGLSPDPVKDQTASYGRGPADELLSVAQGGTARLSLSDRHGDVVGTMSATDGAAAAPAQSTAYDPFGRRLGNGESGGISGNAGYQGDYTDPDTAQINMGARWYDAGTGTFDSRDSYTYASGASILANRYTYGAGAPLDYSDPDGHWPSCGWCKKALAKGKKLLDKGGEALESAGRAVWKGASAVLDAIVYTARHPIAAFKKTVGFLGKAASYVYEKTGLKTAVNAVVKVLRDVGQKTGVTQWAKEKAVQARRAAQEVKAAVTRKAKQAASFAARHNPIPDIVAAAKPYLAVAKAIVTADPNLPALVVSAARTAVADLAKAAERVREVAVQQMGAIVETVNDAVEAAKAVGSAMVEGLKVGLNVLAEVSGYNDIKNCVTKGDMEACVWAVATVAGAVSGGAGAVAVRSAKAARVAAKVAKYSDKIAKAAEKVEKVEDAVDKVETAADAVSCVNTLASANSFTAGTEVLMADGTRKPIEDVVVGDEVTATDPTTGRTAKREVTGTIVGEGDKHLVEVTIDTDGPRGNATEKITATEGHPFWSPSLNKWLKAGELKPGQWLQTGSGTWVQVAAVRAWTQRAAVYNLTVDTAHTYYVAAGATPVLVHNNNGCILPTPSVSDSKLQNLVDDLYKGTTNPARTGDGTTMSAIRDELSSAQLVHGRNHVAKGNQYAKALNKWIGRNHRDGDPHDLIVARSLLADLKSTLVGN